MGFIVSSCAFVCTDNCPELFASWTMMLNFSCPTFTFPNHHQLQTWIHAAIFPFLAWSYLGIAKALKLFQVRKREISQTQKATFHIVFKGEGYSRNTVLPLWGEKKIQSFWGFFLFTSARKIISKKKKKSPGLKQALGQKRMVLRSEDEGLTRRGREQEKPRKRDQIF